MADRGRGGDAESTDELLYTDIEDISSVFGQDPQPLRLDHCDLLLDAMDVELGQLRVQPQNHREIFRKHDCSSSSADPPKWSESLSKDTGLGSTTQTNDTPMSCLDLIHTPMMEQTSERTSDCRGGPDTQEETGERLDIWRRDKEEVESRREQVIWRLKRLLGDTCKEDAMAGETCPPSDSICTEDFVQRFKEEMVEMALPSNVQHPGEEEEAKSTEITDSDRNQNVRGLLNFERRESATPGKSSNETVTAHCSQSHKPGQQKGLEKGLPGSFGVNISQKHVDDSSTAHKPVIVTEHENQEHNNNPSPKARCLAGVPVRSFDSVSIASDLDSVCTEEVRQHIDRLPGKRLQKTVEERWHSLIQSVTDTDDYLTNQSDYDTLTHEESEPQPIHPSVHRSSNVLKRSPSVNTAQHKKRETYSDNDKDTDEEVNHRSWSWRSKRTSEKMQSDWAKMKQRLTDLQQKCEKEEETLRLKRAQLKDIEFCLSELRQRRKHALQELEQLTAETVQMEKEKQSLQSVLGDSRVERDSVSYHLNKLQKQRESCLHEIRNMEEELETLSQHRKSLKERNGVIMSLLEREEMERQLDNAKTELFAEQRRARERLESVQENLEETREELQRANEAESSLRSQCVCLEKELIQKKEQIEALKVQVNKLQVELGECKIRVGTLEKMLAQRELQLLDSKEQCGVLQEERDGLKVELQHLKTQHYKTLREAQEQNQRSTVNQRAEEEKTSSLKEQTLTLTRCIESMQISIQQLKEEEVQKLRRSLEQQREEAKNREEELHVEASGKVHKAVEEERRKWEAEKVEAVQMHCGILEEQNRKGLESVRSEMQQEKSKAQALQHKVLELKRKVQELESESCAQQREQDSLLAVICKSLKEEHQAELQKLKKQMAQESQRTVLQLEQAVQLAVEEAERLQSTLGERDSSHDQTTADLKQQLRHWAHELGAECQHLHLLLEQSGAKQNSVQLPTSSSTVAEALTNLRVLREELQDLISHLHQELDSQKQTTAQLRKDMEQEMSLQRQQLRLERDQALDSLKERLIQEHIEELSSLNRSHTSDGGAEGGGVAVSLRKQLKAKDLELRHVQRSMSQWKEQTTARLARKFEEELTAELERKTSKTRGEKQTRSDRPERELTFSAKETQNSVCSPCPHVLDSAASHSPSDWASFKLLRYLQSRVTQLRLENQAHTWSSSPPDKVPLDLSGSYLTTITQGQDSGILQTQSAIRTLPS